MTTRKHFEKSNKELLNQKNPFQIVKVFFFFYLLPTCFFLNKTDRQFDQVAAVGGFLLVKGLEAAVHCDIELNSF